MSYKLDYESSEKREKPERFIEDKNTKFILKENNKETKKKDFNEFIEESPEKEVIQKKAVKREENDSDVDESVNLEELEHIKVKKYNNLKFV